MTHATPEERYSPRLLALFGRYAAWHFGGHFNALRVARDGPVPRLDRPTVLYCNHPAWWDPLLLLLFATRCTPGMRVFAPIDAPALERYSILARLGLFPIERGTPAGAREFLRVAERVLDAPATALAITAQGRFADPRERPILLQTGTARVLASRPERQAVPVAIEYVFWEERLPEALLRFGSPIRSRAGERTGELHRRLEAGLETTMDALARLSIERDTGAFETLVTGRRRGVGGVYDLFERARHAVRNRRFESAHRSIGT